MLSLLFAITVALSAFPHLHKLEGDPPTIAVMNTAMFDICHKGFPVAFCQSTAGLHCAVAAGPGMIPGYTGFWKMSKGHSF